MSNLLPQARNQAAYKERRGVAVEAEAAELRMATALAEGIGL